jgi:hypothetical protein
MQKNTLQKKNEHLSYGEGQREQFGEGHRYRAEEKTEGADKFNDHDFAGGEREDKPLPDPQKPAGE